MKKNDMEFLNLMREFEKAIRAGPFTNYSLDRVSKDDKVPTGIFYNNGSVNQLFHAYMMGYMLAKCLRNIDALPD